MRSSRLLLAVSAICLASTLTACGGGDDKPDAGSSPTGSATKGDDAGKVNRTCKAEVEVTGSVAASWTGKGTSMRMTSGPQAIYRAEKGDAQIVLYAPGKDFETTANFTQGDQTFTTQLGDKTGLDIAGSGRSATVDADAVGVKPDDAAHLSATFHC